MPKAKKKAKQKQVKVAARPAVRKTTKPAEEPAGAKLTFNHAMIYARDVARSAAFYSGLLGFKQVDEFRYEGQPVYARLRAPGGDGTIAIHQANDGGSTASPGVRLYFEIQDLDGFCEKLKRKGVYFTQVPKMMPWGWKHAYVDDPDGHEVSLYWAGAKRMKKTVMQAAKEAAKVPAARRSRR